MGECIGHVSILDRVRCQANAAGEATRSFEIRAVVWRLHQHTSGVGSFRALPPFDWRDAGQYAAILGAMSDAGWDKDAGTTVVSLVASLQAWATMGRDRARVSTP